ncbi:MAG: glucose-6-phosphate 1-dehydrogenase [Candidatus Parcubacteria bacterium]|nr:MAG: glucose-6-phosphate 1-dehydrogenase [Candidatus Parcubacteria bacterium]
MPHQKLPVTFILMGATGDLALSRLWPALARIQSELSHARISVVAVATSERTQNDYAAFVREKSEPSLGPAERAALRELLARTRYVAADTTQLKAFAPLLQAVYAIDAELGVCSNKILYLALPPKVLAQSLIPIAHSGLSLGCRGVGDGWVRIAVEKPFGEDEATARQLDETLSKMFADEYVYRIDHYLGKSAVENILTFRFTNSLLISSWGCPEVERIRVRLWEKRGVEGRGAFFDKVGQLRDVGQNHILQMLAVALMEDPKAYTAEAIRASRAQALRFLEPVPSDLAWRGQYVGYRAEAGIDATSQTETAFRIEAHSNHPRWRGARIMLESAKKAPRDLVEVAVIFRERDTCLCDAQDATDTRNVVRFVIQPEAKTQIRFFVRSPSLESRLRAKEVSLPFAEAERIPDAYELLLRDILMGRPMVFPTSAEVAAQWRFADAARHILEQKPLAEYSPEAFPQRSLPAYQPWTLSHTLEEM